VRECLFAIHIFLRISRRLTVSKTPAAPVWRQSHNLLDCKNVTSVGDARRDRDQHK
jgi:hypothetical protein